MPSFTNNWFNSTTRKAAFRPTGALREHSHSSDTATFIDDDDTSSPPSLTFSQGPSSPESTDSLSDNSKMQISSASPIDIATPTRNSSSSPSSQIQKPNYIDQDSRASAIMSGATMDNGMGRGRQESFAGAKPISMNNPNRNADGRPRRESMANSLVGGMSWGGVSVGSWIRDDIIMAGTSPFPYQSPSYHSSSYLPKLEANFMRDFSCCGQTLPTLHDLLQHYEESHAQQTPHSHRASSAAARARENSTPNSKAALAAQAASAVQQQAQQQNQQPQQVRAPIQQGGAPVGGIQLMRQQQSQPQTPVQQHVQPVSEDMEGVEDMEMDDAIGPLDQAPETPMQAHQQPVQNMQPSMFGQQPRPNLNINSNGLQHSGLRTSQPPTPAASGFGFQNNPTVSSVNTPTLSAQPFQQQQQTFSPDTSVPGTPAGEMDDDFGTAQMNMNNPNLAALNAAMAAGDFPFFPNGNGGQMGLDSLGLDLCIDEPAKRLYSPNGGYNNQRQMQQQFAQFGLGQAQGQFGNNDHLMRLYRQQQAMALSGMGNGGMMMGGEEHKPFRCPVIGCEKAYKNQNGLKYHKTHGHQTQRLHENGDGTFSIVNPETSAPYPGTLGMEKEKPYKCEVCGKRYKNLNGLKYHKQHSPPCNPELKLNSHMAAVGLGGLGVNVNVAGLPGIGEEGFIS